MLAPLWLAIGAVQLLARKSGARFASWLVGIALTIIASVIMMVDPILQDTTFTKSLPPGGRHWGLLPGYLLGAAHVGVALVLLGGVVLAVLRWRGGDDYDADNMHALLAIGPTGLALIGAVSFTVPGLFTALLLFVTAAAVWYVVLRPLAPYEDEDEDDEPEDDWEERRPVGRRAATEPPRDVQVAGRRALPEESPRDVQVAGRRTLPEESPRRSGLGDLVAEYRAGEQDVDYAARMQRQPPVQVDPFGGPATGTFMAGEYGMPSPGQPAGGAEYTRQPPMTGQFGMPPGNQATGEYDVPVNEYGRPTAPAAGGPGRPVGPSTGEFARPDPLHGAQPGGSLQPMPADQAFGAPSGYGQSAAPGLGGAPGYGETPGYGQAPDRGPGGVPGYGQAPDRGLGGPPATGSAYPGAAADQPGGSSRPSPGIFGLLTVFTLIDGTGEAFDRLAEETLEAVRRSEPDTLVYVCHSVKSAPLQRIVYELYRDEVAYTEHQRQPHVERFVSERQNMVLATNVIELNINAAKVMPLPMAFRL
ncbi:putative quinol monooxygenase [Streptosporangium canum]|uniref:putative quinol monooxygenase n=1 Tax=Streptosporangium canum TaxID=324952 RepID=UPI0037A636C7